MPHNQMLMTILIIVLGTMITRFLVFLIFPPTKEPPRFITYLGKVLPPSAIGLLVIYALKDIQITKMPFVIPELVAILVIIIMHKWRRNTLISIASGTIVYMLFVQVVF